VTAKITLTWDNGSSEHVDQIVYRSAETFTVDNLPPVLARVGRNAREYIDTDIVTGNTHFYAVASENVIGEILLSSVISVTAKAPVSDPHWDNVVALLHFDGDLNDETGKTWDSNREMEYQEGFFGEAGKFYNTQYMTCTHEDFLLGSDDFTIEFYLKIALAGDYQLFDMRPATGTHNQILIESYGGELDLWVNGAYALGPFSNLITAGEIYHIALTRKNGVVYMFCNGNLLGSAPLSNYFTRPTINLGGGVTDLADRFYLNGFLDELRVTKGVARYTENFTPPTEPFPNY